MNLSYYGDKSENPLIFFGKKIIKKSAKISLVKLVQNRVSREMKY
jgi:hypothetical protein